MYLFDICMKLADIENGLADGTIDFVYDALMCVLKPGHPADILNSLYCDYLDELFVDLRAEFDLDDIKELHEDLIAFKEDFQVAELEPVINDLATFIAEREEEA